MTPPSEKPEQLVRGVLLTLSVASVRDRDRANDALDALIRQRDEASAKVKDWRAYAVEKVDTIASLEGALREAEPVIEYVSRGRRYVDVTPYPDAVARRVNAQLKDALAEPAAAENVEGEEVGNRGIAVPAARTANDGRSASAGTPDRPVRENQTEAAETSPSTTPERCPTCGSEDPKVRHLRIVARHPAACPDPWHTKTTEGDE